MAYDLIKISGLPLATPDNGQDIVVGVGDYAKRINYGDVKADMVGTTPTYTTDTEPYLMRRTAHVGVVGKCALNKLVGGSIGWNQLCNGSSVTVPSGHKYYMKKSGTASIGASTGSAITGLASGTDMVIDLTTEFGSTIADYVYGLESATAGSGIAWLSKYIDLGIYHAYDSGSIHSVQATAHVTKDADDNVIGNYPLGSDTLRGIPQLVSNKLKFDGDEKTPDGTITRKYGIITFSGSENWQQGGSNPNLFYLTKNATTFPYLFGESVKAVSNLYTYAGAFTGSYATHLSGGDFLLYYSSSLNSTRELALLDMSVNTLSAFKSKMNSTPLVVVYELATETTESSTAFQKVQTIDADGTESFVTSSPVPVGHETQTPDNILAALGWLGE